METQFYKETINSITYDVSCAENFYKVYRLNDKYHNESGPAIIDYSVDGNILKQEYYVFDKQFNSLEELQHHLKYKNF